MKKNECKYDDINKGKDMDKDDGLHFTAKGDTQDVSLDGNANGDTQDVSLDGNAKGDNESICDDNQSGKEPKADETLAMYEKVFKQFELALNKAEKEIAKEKSRADENEHIARVYRQDLERFKERNKNIQQESLVNANVDTALKLLPVLDNFDKAISTIIDASLAKGFVMIFNNLKEIIANLGLEEIDSLGQNFDPQLHECISKVKAIGKGKSGVVSRVFKTGYKLKGENAKVVRPSVVEIYE